MPRIILVKQSVLVKYLTCLGYCFYDAAPKVIESHHIACKLSTKMTMPPETEQMKEIFYHQIYKSISTSLNGREAYTNKMAAPISVCIYRSSEQSSNMCGQKV